MDMLSEMISPAASSDPKKALLSTCISFLLLALYILASFIISLFWEVLKVFLFRTSLKYNVVRVGLVLFLVVVSGVCVAILKGQSNLVSFAEYVQFTFIASWVLAFVICLVDSVLLLLFVFSHSVKCRKQLIVHIVIVLFMVLFAVISPISFGFVAIGITAGTIAFVVFIPLIAAGVVLFAYFRGKKRDRKSFIFNTNVSLLVLALLIFTVIISLFVNTPATCTATCKDQARNHAETVDRQSFSSIPYQICSKRWSSVELNIAELAFFANLTYNQALESRNSTKLLWLVNGFFFQKRNIEFTLQNDLQVSSKYFHMQHQDIHIVGVRGPVTNTEFAESARLWDEIAALQSLGMFLPILNYFPIEFISEYVAQTSFITKIFHGGSTTRLFDDIEDNIKQINQTHKVILVGHSFGGGIAKIIGARLQKQAVAFSSPGITYGHLKFGFTLENAAKFVVSITPQNDNVPLIDKHAGLVQNVNCDGKTYTQCHLIVRTYCELHNGCGLADAGCQAMIDN